MASGSTSERSLGLIKKLWRISLSSGLLFVAAGLQFIFFLTSARLLGLAPFGELSTLFAFVAPIGELIGMGSSDRLIQEVSRWRGAYATFFCSALFSNCLTFLVLCPLLTWLSTSLFNPAIDITATICIFAAELLPARMMVLAESIMIANARSLDAGYTRVFIGAARASYAVIFWMSCPFPSLVSFALGYAAIMIVTMVALLGYVVRAYGPPEGPVRLMPRKADLSFALYHFGRSLTQALDRIALSLTLSYDALGIYSAGSRTLQVATLPILAILRDALPGFAQAGQHGVSNALVYGIGISPRVGLVTIVSTLGAILFALSLPILLGHNYSPSASIGAIVSSSAIFIAVQYVAGDVLTGSDRQHSRAIASACSLAAAFPIMIVLSRSYGLYGAAVGLVVSQAFAALLHCGAVILAVRRESKSAALP